MSNFHAYDVDKTELFDFKTNYFTSFTLNISNNSVLTFNLSYKYNKIFLWYPNSTVFVAKNNIIYKYYLGNTIYKITFLDVNDLNNTNSNFLTPENIFSQFKIGYVD